MADKRLHSRSTAAVGDGQGNPVVTNESVVTDCVQITDQIVAGDVITVTAAKDLDSVSQQVTISAVQLQDILASVKKVQAEISKQAELQTAALEARLTAVSDSLNSNLNSVRENLKMEIRTEKEKLASSLTNQFMADNGCNVRYTKRI